MLCRPLIVERSSIQRSQWIFFSTDYWLLATGYFLSSDVVPRVNRCERTMIRHVAFERCDGDTSLFDGLVICAVVGAFAEILFADPEIGFAARVYVLADDRARLLDALPCDADALDLCARDVDVEQRPVGQALLENFAHGDDGKARGFREIKLLARHEADRQARHT